MATAFRRKVREGKGDKAKSSVYIVKFRDHRGDWRRLQTDLTDKRAATEMGRKLERASSLRAAGEQPDPELAGWLEKLPQEIRAKLATWGVLDSRSVNAGVPLEDHLGAYRQALLDGVASARQKGPATAKHAETVHTRVKALLKGIGATYLSEVRPEAVGRYLAERRTKVEAPDHPPAEARKPEPTKEAAPKKKKTAWALSVRTSNHVLQNGQSFFAWMVRTRRASENPLASLSKIQVTDKARKIVRRAMEHEEATKLLDAARTGSDRFGMDGESRYWLYRLAMETGLRSAELRSLTRSSFRLEGDEPNVWLSADSTKNRKAADLPLRTETAEELRGFMGKLHPAAAAFPTMPPSYDVADMLREDLKAAGVEAETAAGRIDFHSLRGSCLSWLAAAGTPVKDLQEFARHSDPKLTMNVYTHVLRGSLAGAAARLPNLSRPTREQAKATGTYDATPTCAPPAAPRPCQSAAVACSDSQSKPARAAAQKDSVFSGRSGKNATCVAPSDDSHRSDSNRRPAVYKTAGEASQVANSQGLSDSEAESRTTSGTKAAPKRRSEAQLAAVVAAWSGLPEAIRAGIVAMVEAARSTE